MITGSVDWTAALNAQQKTPLFTFEIEEAELLYSSFVPDLDVELDVPPLPYLMTPAGISQKIDELEAHSSISKMIVELIDPTGELKTLSADVFATGMICNLKMGFDDTDLSDFVLQHRGRISAIGETEKGTIQIEISDFIGDLVQDIFVNGGPDAWTPGDPPNLPPPSPNAWRDNGQPISDKNPRYLSGNPIDLILAACQNELGFGQDEPPVLVVNSGGDTSSGTGIVGYSVNPDWTFYEHDGTGLINPSWGIDVDECLALRDKYFNSDRVEFPLTSAQNGKRWIEEQLMKPFGLYWVTKANGQLSLRSLKNPAPDEINIVDIDQREIIGIPKVDRRTVINVIDAAVVPTADPEADNSDKVDIPLATQRSLRAGYRAPYIHNIDSDGLRFGLATSGRLLMTSGRIFNRNSFSTPVYTVKTYFKHIVMEVGDFFRITHPKMLDLRTGTRGITDVICQVMERRPNYTTGQIEFTVLDTRSMGWGGSDGPFAFYIAAAADSIPDWDSATDEQKARYLFISDDDADPEEPATVRGRIL